MFQIFQLFDTNNLTFQIFSLNFVINYFFKEKELSVILCQSYKEQLFIVNFKLKRKLFHTKY